MSKMTRELKADILQIVNECITEEATNKICKKVSSEIEKKMSSWENKFAKIDQMATNLNKLNNLDILAKQIVDLNSSLKDLTASLDSNKKDILQLQKTNDHIQQLSKSNILRFCGLEKLDNEDPVEIAASFVSTHLNIACTVQDIDFAYRIGKPGGSQGNKATILVKFVNYWKRSQIMKARKSLKNSGIGVSIFEDLTKSRYDALVEAKKKYGKHAVWSADGKIYGFIDGKKVLIKHNESE